MNFLTRLFKRKRKRYAFNPDYIVRPSQSILEAMGYIGIDESCRWELMLNLSPEMTKKIMNDEIRISKRVAMRMAKVLGSAPEFWFNLSKNYHDKKGGKDA